MNRTLINFVLDTLLLANFTVLMWLAVVVRFLFPVGADTRGWLLWGYDYNQWSTFQFAALSVLAVGILIHLMLHWNWVCGVVATRFFGGGKIDDGTQTLYGVGLLIVIVNVVGFAIAAAALSIQAPR